MKSPFGISYDEAETLTWTRADSGVEGVSRRLVTIERSPNVALYHATAEPPLEYSGLNPHNDMIYYGLEGRGTVTVGDRDFDLTPGRAVFVPAGIESRQTSDERTTFLIIWGPAPHEDPNVEPWKTARRGSDA